MSQIQDLIDQAASGAVVTPPAGTYTVDINEPIRLKSDLTLDLSGVRLRMLPNDRVFQVCLVIDGCKNVTIIGGVIKGERASRPLSPEMGGGGGGLIVIGGAKNILVRNTIIGEFFGDGVYLVHGSLELDHVILDHNRRQGLSASDVNGLWIHDCTITANGGTAPGAGIDLEPDLVSQSINNVKIERCNFARNAGAGVLIACPPAQRHNITISNNSFSGKPVDGTDGIVSWWAKLIGPFTGWLGYPRNLYIP